MSGIEILLHCCDRAGGSVNFVKGDEVTSPKRVSLRILKANCHISWLQMVGEESDTSLTIKFREGSN